MSLTVIPNPSVCEFDAKAPIRNLAAQAEEVLRANECEHVCRVELLPRDSLLYAILDAPCFDADQSRAKCSKKVSEALLLFAFCFSERTRTLTTTVKVEVRPAASLQLGRGDESAEALHRTHSETFVLYPRYKTLSEWRYSLPIRFLRGEVPKAESIYIYLNFKKNEVKSTNAVLNLGVVVPPLSKESEASMDFITVVVLESIKLLMKDGWDFLKRHLPGIGSGDDLITLNIGDTKILPADVAEDQNAVLTQALRNSNIRMSNLQVEELGGLNKRVETLSRQRQAMQGRVERTGSGIDYGRTQAEIEELGQEISVIEEKIWNILQGTGVISVIGKDRKAG